MSDETVKKKTPRKQATRNKATAKKTAAKKATAKKAATRKSAPAKRKAAAPSEAPAVKLSASSIKESLAATADAPRIVGVPKEERHRLIAQRAYKLATERGFRDGDPLQDWLKAEAEIEAEIGR